MRSGTMHIFAISGLHITMIAAILVQLMRIARLPRVACGLLLIPMLWFLRGSDRLAVIRCAFVGHGDHRGDGLGSQVPLRLG